MKSIIFISILAAFFIGNNLFAQTNDRFVISAAGEANQMYSYTLGEPVVSNNPIDNTVKCFEGFQGGLNTLFSSFSKIEESQILVFPNPSLVNQRIKITTGNVGQLAVYLYSSTGALISNCKEVDDDIYAPSTPGVYFLRIVVANEVRCQKLTVIQ